MTERRIKDEYFRWIANRLEFKDYKILHALNDIPFRYVVPDDDSRLADAVDMRYRFGHDNGYPNVLVAQYLDLDIPSVLEVLSALCFRLEDEIMQDDYYADRVPLWFSIMMENLGLYEDMDVHKIQGIVDTFLDRQYDAHGKGNIFRIKSNRYDMRNIELWYQMFIFLRENNYIV